MESCPTNSPSSILQKQISVLENIPLARDTFRIRLESPELATLIRPGQFLMLRLPNRTDPLLGRPFALYDTVHDERGMPVGLDVVYLVLGKQTKILTSLKPGDPLEIWGPLGNGFPNLEGHDHIALVAGGIGQTPFLAYIRHLLGTRSYGGLSAKCQVKKVSVYYGVRNRELAAGVEDFKSAGAEVHLATDDGSVGFHGFVTQLLETHLQQNPNNPPSHLTGCGPEPMLHALADLARRHQLPCQVSLETPMACGVGICFSCVTPVKTSDGFDYKRVCVEGPVFDAHSLAWE